MKRTIAAMTVGKDVSGLFPDVVNCIQTSNLELKKLVYLYLINYAQTNPDMTLMAVNTFVKDAADYNPLVRALAIRTMSCINVDKIVLYLCDPLRKAIKDSDPYVRKTAAIAVAKLYHISPSLVEDEGFLDSLSGMLNDDHPMVFANVLKAMEEISLTRPGYYSSHRELVPRLLGALGQSNEWCQVYLLEALGRISLSTIGEADEVVESVTPRLQHANPSVVLGAICVIASVLQHYSTGSMVDKLYKKLSASLVTLMSGEPEIQYISLRCMNLLAQAHPGLVSQEVRVFFCKFNDPLYVKKEKLLLIYGLANSSNLRLVLNELKEYTAEIDEAFVRKSIAAIGKIARKFPEAAEPCVSMLLDLVKSKTSHVVEEAVIAMKDVFRQNPDRYFGVAEVLCRELDEVGLPSARASIVS